jgi:bifunctional ADP-heptose synthase (sugar kinase/adenylyltransferase)
MNRKEAETFACKPIETKDDAVIVANAILHNWATKAVVITLGAEGILYLSRYENPIFTVENPLNVYDVCGAGDVVIATLAYIMVQDEELNVKKMMYYATKAGRIAVSKKGTSYIAYNEVFEEKQNNYSESKFEMWRV